MPFQMHLGEGCIKKPFRIDMNKFNIRSNKEKSQSNGHALTEPKQFILDMDWNQRQWFCVVVNTDTPVSYTLSSVTGQFGHQCHFDENDSKGRHIKQLSWARGTFDEAKDKSHPWDRYSTWSAIRKRYDLNEALVEMLTELKYVLDAGGGLCMYDVEFEAALVLETMTTLQLPEQYLLKWQEAATTGRALLNLDLLRWAFDYPSKIEPVEFHKICGHVLGKTVQSGEPGLQCWMLFRKMHLKVHAYMSSINKDQYQIHSQEAKRQELELEPHRQDGIQLTSWPKPSISEETPLVENTKSHKRKMTADQTPVEETSTRGGEYPKPKRHGSTTVPKSCAYSTNMNVGPSMPRLIICIYKVTDRACDCWRRFEGMSVPLWQVPRRNVLIALMLSDVQMLIT